MDLFTKTNVTGALASALLHNKVLTIKDTLKDPVLITINEDLDNVSEEKLAKIIRKELENILLRNNIEKKSKLSDYKTLINSKYFRRWYL